MTVELWLSCSPAHPVCQPSKPRSLRPAEILFTSGAPEFLPQEITSNEFLLRCIMKCVWDFCSTGQKMMSFREGFRKQVNPSGSETDSYLRPWW